MDGTPYEKRDEVEKGKHSTCFKLRYVALVGFLMLKSIFREVFISLAYYKSRTQLGTAGDESLYEKLHSVNCTGRNSERNGPDKLCTPSF